MKIKVDGYDTIYSDVSKLVAQQVLNDIVWECSVIQNEKLCEKCPVSNYCLMGRNFFDVAANMTPEKLQELSGLAQDIENYHNELDQNDL